MNEGAAIPAATPGPPTIPSPRFDVLDAEEVRHAAAPLLRFAGHVTEPEGREVYTIALSVQIMIDPARRRYDDDTKERLVDLFGEPERWSATTHSFLWAEVDVLLPAFTGATGFRIPLPASYDLEVAAAKYLYALPEATCRSRSTSRARSSTGEREGGCRSGRCRGTARRATSCRCGTGAR